MTECPSLAGAFRPRLDLRSAGRCLEGREPGSVCCWPLCPAATPFGSTRRGMSRTPGPLDLCSSGEAPVPAGWPSSVTADRSPRVSPSGRQGLRPWRESGSGSPRSSQRTPRRRRAATPPRRERAAADGSPACASRMGQLSSQVRWAAVAVVIRIAQHEPGSLPSGHVVAGNLTVEVALTRLDVDVLRVEQH